MEMSTAWRMFRREMSVGKDDDGAVKVPVVATSSVAEDNENDEDDHDDGSLGSFRWALEFTR